MPWIVLSLSFLVIIGVCGFSSRRLKSDSTDGRLTKNILLAVQGVLLAFWALFTLVSVFHSVDVNEVGIVRTFGNITGQRESGLQLTSPWQSLDTVLTRNQSFTNSAVKKDTTDQFVSPVYVAFSKETQDVFVRASLVYHVSRGNVQNLIRESGFNYFDNIRVESLLINVLKEETVKFPAIEIAPNRELIRQAVAARLSESLGKHSILVDQFTLDNIDFDGKFKQAISEKAAATQNAQAEQNKVALETAKAEQDKQRGIAAANLLRETANGQADANRTIAASLTPQLVQFQAIQKLGDKIQIALIPSGQGVIIDPTTLFGKANP